MALIPTYTATESAKTGPAQAYGNEDAFGGQVARGMSVLAGGVQDVGSAVTHVANTVAVLGKQKKQLQDTKWAGEMYESKKRAVSEFMADPVNNTKESFAQDLDQHIQDQVSSVDSKSAPSPRAYQMFRSNFGSFAGSKYAQALGVGYQNMVTNGVQSISDQISDAVTAYHNFSKVDEDTATHDMVDSVAHIGQNIEGSFRSTAPNVADKLHSELITQSVLATMSADPRAAKTLLDSSRRIDEQTRRTLNNEITQMLKTKDIVAREAFDNTRTNQLVKSEQGQSGVKLSIDSYRQFYPDDQAQVQKSRDDAYIDTMTRANTMLSEMGSHNSEDQLKRLNDLGKNINSEQDKEVYKKVHADTVINLKMQDTNPVGWLIKYNTTIQSLMRKAADAPQKTQTGEVQTLNDAVMRYQGPAPSDASPEEKLRYLDRPMNDRHLLDLNDATQSAADLNMYTPKEFIQKMGQSLNRYPDPQHQYVAFNDMVTMPGRGQGLKQEYQVAWQNKDAWWLDTYLGALSAGKDIKIPEDIKKDVAKRIDANPEWIKFQSATVGESFARSGQVAGYREGLKQYAHALISQGKSMKEASDTAVKDLILTTLGTPKVNGKPFLMLRDQGPNLPPRTDAQLDDMGRRLTLGLQFIDPRKVDQRPFTALQIFGKDEQHLPRLQALRDQITARGFFQTGPDGQSVSLYSTDDRGDIFQVRDRNNQPFNISFKDLPAFPTHKETLGGLLRTEGLPASEYGTGIRSTYDLVEQPYSFFNWATSNRSGHSITNWPSDPSWLHAPVKPK